MPSLNKVVGTLRVPSLNKVVGTLRVPSLNFEKIFDILAFC